MSAEDRLRRAARSLRDEAGELTPNETARTRARVMASLTVVQRRRNRAIFLLIPVAAVLAASFALAHEGVTLRRAWGWLADHAGGAKEPARVETARPKMSAVEPAPENATSPETVVAPEVSALAPKSLPTATTATSLRASRAPTPPANASPPSSPPARSAAVEAPASSDETDAAGLALYRKAHRLHFVDHDYAASVAAWDDYLRSVPGGPLAVEARYNRALALVHLGRGPEARSALEPFALGRVEGGYRQAEASALLNALDARDR
jgi:hypothetical protein